MAAFSDEIVTLLNADSPLLSTLTGGVYNYPAGGRKGLNRVQLQNAFDATTGLLKPTAVVLETDEKPSNEIVGINTSIVVPVLIWIYNDGSPGASGTDPYSTIKTAFDRIYTLLHLAQIAGAVQILYAGGTKYKRDPELQDAAYFRADYNVFAYR